MNPAEVAAILIAVIVPLFVAMDPIGALPLVVAWTSELSEEARRRQLRDALLTGLALGSLFIAAGRPLLVLLGVSIADFLVAGGIVLLVLAVTDIVAGGGHEARGSVATPDFGAVPIGTPILAGPATLATLLVLVDRYGYLWTSLGLVVTLVLAWQLLVRATSLTRLFGRNGLRAASKVASLILAAIAVHLIRDGLMTMVSP